nr:MAG TPA: hypothetical protein [Caudoviricetes sp.]
MICRVRALLAGYSVCWQRSFCTFTAQKRHKLFYGVIPENSVQ